ncbi:MAG: hypothetical protein Q7R92_03195 [bacterium]|nr:hypothetical protein [bacterium]
MLPKNALLILLMLAAMTALVFAVVYFGRQAGPKQNTGTANNLNLTGEKPAAGEAERKIIQQEELVNKKIQEKNAQINAKPQEVIQKQGYTQAELDFIANPKATAEQELGIKPSQPKTEVKPYTQSQLDAIANPKK